MQGKERRTSFYFKGKLVKILRLKIQAKNTCVQCNFRSGKHQKIKDLIIQKPD